MCGGGGIGGLLGDILGGAAGLFLGPEVGIPLALATGAGSAIGGTIGGIASGEKPGQALLGGLEAGALTGIGTGISELAAGQGFFGSASPFGNIFGGGAAPTATGGATADLGTQIASTGGFSDVGTVPVATDTGAFFFPATGSTLAASGIPGTAASVADVTPSLLTGTGIAPGTGLGMGAAPAGAAGGGGAPAGSIASNVGASSPTGGSSAEVGGALPIAPPTLTQGIGTSLPGPPITPIGPTAGESLPSVAAAMPAQTGNFFTPGTSGVAVPGTTDGSFTSGLMNYLTQNPGLLLSGGGLLMSMMMNNNIPYMPQLQHAATTGTQTGGQLIGQGEQNANALTTGLLPPGAQSAIDQATAAAKASTLSNFANLGLSGSTMATQALAGIDQAAAAQKFSDLSQVSQLGLQQIGAGQNAINEANSVYGNIMNTTLQQDFLTQMAIANLAASLAGSTRGISTG